MQITVRFLGFDIWHNMWDSLQPFKPVVYEHVDGEKGFLQKKGKMLNKCGNKWTRQWFCNNTHYSLLKPRDISDHKYRSEIKMNSRMILMLFGWIHSSEEWGELMMSLSVYFRRDVLNVKALWLCYMHISSHLQLIFYFIRNA